MTPELWLDEANGIVRQVNMVTVADYHFSTAEEAKRAHVIMQTYIDRWSRKKKREPLYPENLIQACEKQGIRVLHFHAGTR